MEGLVGSYVGSYSIIRLLTQGDTTEIYLGEDTQTKKRAALKIISLAKKESLSQKSEEPVDADSPQLSEEVKKEDTPQQSQKPADNKLSKETKKLKRMDKNALLQAQKQAEKEALQAKERLADLLQKPQAKRLQAEARLLMHFNHMHLLRIFEMGVTDTIAYMAQEYIHNSSFYKHYPKGTPLPQKLILSYVKQIAETLHYLHGLKVYHRNLKPEHLLLAPSNRIVLCGFGQAISPWEPSQESMLEFKGTPTYTAPEQFQNTCLPASDQYALAIMAYEWFCGEPPFSGSAEELEHDHQHMPPPSLIAKRAELSPAIERALFIGLAKEPERRFGNVNAFVHALEQASAIKP